MNAFLARIRTLQQDDHRYYHQCRINQTLHLVSALSFLLAYALLAIDPAVSGLIGWLVGMVTRQSGHIFFEPRGFDRRHQVSYAHKEAIKAGYNMRRKTVLITIWLGLPLLLALSPSLFGLIEPSKDASGWLHDVGMLWLALGAAGLLFRTLHLFWLRGPAWGLAWCAKILLDPFHNVHIYWRSPLWLMQGQRLDPLLGQHTDAAQRHDDDALAEVAQHEA
jgi:hypothetical protein